VGTPTRAYGAISACFDGIITDRPLGL
jgi:hypothetical protein